MFNNNDDIDFESIAKNNAGKKLSLIKDGTP
jgi:hypothetical protein